MKTTVAKRLGLNISQCKKDLYSFGSQTNPVSQSLSDQHADCELRKLIEILLKEQHERTTEEKQHVKASLCNH